MIYQSLKSFCFLSKLKIIFYIKTLICKKLKEKSAVTKINIILLQLILSEASWREGLEVWEAQFQKTEERLSIYVQIKATV